MKTKKNKRKEILQHNFAPENEIKKCEEMQNVYYFHIPSYMSIHSLDILLISYYPHKIWDFVHMSSPSKRQLKIFDEKFVQHLKKHSLELLHIEQEKVIVERPVLSYTPIGMKKKDISPEETKSILARKFSFHTWQEENTILTNQKTLALELLDLGFVYCKDSTRTSLIRGNSVDLLEYIQEKKEKHIYESLPPEAKGLKLITR